MADKHPYVSGTGALKQILDHLRSSFPSTLNADVLRKLGFAPKNESYVINILRFLNLIDEESARTESARRIFTLHDNAAFAKDFSDLVKSAYADLFTLHGDKAWQLDDSKLITFFRQTDQSSELVGKRQANTFRALAAYAGQVEQITSARTKAPPRKKRSVKTQPAALEASDHQQALSLNTSVESVAKNRNLSLAVRIEINLPLAPDQDTYDRIFRSIRENLLNG